MEAFTFELKLIDSVSASSKKAAAAVEAIEKSAKKTREALSWHREIEKTEQALHKISGDPVGLKKYIHYQKELLEQKKKINKAIGKETFGEALAGKLSLGKLVSGAALGDLFAEGLIEGIKMPIEMFAEGLKDAFKDIGKEQQLRAGYSLTLGKEGGDEAREDAERFAGKTAFSASQVQEQMLPLFRAGLKGQDARTMYASATDLAAGQGKGADPEAVSRNVELYARIQQKSGVTSKQLTGVGLGEMNVPAFYKALGLKLGIDAKAAEKLAARPGGVDPKLLRNTLVEAVEKQQGGKTGKGGMEAGKSLEGMLNKLKEAPGEFFRKLVDSPGLKKFGIVIGRILNKLDPNKPEGKKIMAALTGAFESLAEIVDNAFSPENIDKFSAGVMWIVDHLKDIPDVLKKIATVSEIIGTIWVGSKIVGAVTSLVSLMPGLALAVGAITAPMAALAAVAVSVGVAIYRINAAVKELGGLKAVFNDLGDFVKDGGMTPHAESKGNSGFAEMQAKNAANVARAHDMPSYLAPMAQSGAGVPRSVNTSNVSAPITVNVNGGNVHEVKQAVLDAHQHAVSAHERAGNEGG